jgi:hypothetical protein
MKYLTKFLKILGVSLTLVLLPFSLFFWSSWSSFKGLKAKYANASSSFQLLGWTLSWWGDQNDSIPIVTDHGTAASLHTYDAWTSTLKALIAWSEWIYPLTG